jgi:hypothetical protein
VGTAAAAIQGAPVMTQDVDLLIRDAWPNRAKLERLCDARGAGRPIGVSPLPRTLTPVGASVPVDILFDEIAGGLTVLSVARCRRGPGPRRSATIGKRGIR